VTAASQPIKGLLRQSDPASVALRRSAISAEMRSGLSDPQRHGTI